MMRVRYLAIAALIVAAMTVAAQSHGADLVLINGKVFTADPARPWAEAIAVHGDRILDVGATTAITPRAASNARTIDVVRDAISQP